MKRMRPPSAQRLDGRRLRGRQGGRPGGGQLEHLVERLARVRLALGGGLHLDELARRRS